MAAVLCVVGCVFVYIYSVWGEGGGHYALDLGSILKFIKSGNFSFTSFSVGDYTRIFCQLVPK